MRLRLRVQRLGLMAKLLAVALERAEGAEPDAAAADEDVAAGLHVHGEVLLDDKALLVALCARERLVAGEVAA